MSRAARVLPIVLLVAGCLVAPPAGAAEGLFLTWNDCALAPGSAHDYQQPCTSNAGSQELFCAFRMPADRDSVLGVEIEVDIQHADATMPDWWRFDVAGCRAGSLQAGFTFPPASPCVDFFPAIPGGGLQGYTLNQPHGGPNQASIIVTAQWLTDLGYARLDSLNLYFAAGLAISNTLSTGAEACAGCLDPACLVLNSIHVIRQPGTGDVVLTAPGPDNANWATWQGGTGANCSAVPVRTVTWGRLKGLYR